MKYFVKMIQAQEEIETCDKFLVNCAQWNCVKQPETWGYMGYLEGQGLFVRMYCREQDPKREFRNHRENVWKDSAMEVFLAFGRPGTDGRIRDDVLYLNFEMNANGALYAKYGWGKKDRKFVPDRVYEECGCRAEIGEDGWKVEVLFPQWFLAEVCDYHYTAEPGPEQTRMYCNFYKISESPEIEHYMSFQKIESDSPNFHRPSCFAETECVLDA